MRASFKVLTEFLDHFGEEVEGRDIQEPTDELKAKLRQLALGKLPASQRAELFVLLKTNPNSLGWLAQQVKGLRVKAQ